MVGDDGELPDTPGHTHTLFTNTVTLTAGARGRLYTERAAPLRQFINGPAVPYLESGGRANERAAAPSRPPGPPEPATSL